MKRRGQVAPLRPLGNWRAIGRSPTGFSSMVITPDQQEALERVSLDTFTTMVNQGHTFSAALCAVYFSGVMHALKMTSLPGSAQQEGSK